jgi:hypothetical protein
VAKPVAKPAAAPAAKKPLAAPAVKTAPKATPKPPATAKAVPALPPMGSDMGGMVGGGGMQYAVSYQQELYNTWEHNVLSCGEDFLVSVFNFDHPSDNVPVQRKNATFNFAQVFRHNIFEAYATASWRWTRDHVIEHNALLPGYCAFISANVSATPINVSATNVGVVFRA